MNDLLVDPLIDHFYILEYVLGIFKHPRAVNVTYLYTKFEKKLYFKLPLKLPSDIHSVRSHFKVFLGQILSTNTRFTST